MAARDCRPAMGPPLRIPTGLGPPARQEPRKGHHPSRMSWDAPRTKVGRAPEGGRALEVRVSVRVGRDAGARYSHHRVRNRAPDSENTYGQEPKKSRPEARGDTRDGPGGRRWPADAVFAAALDRFIVHGNERV